MKKAELSFRTAYNYDGNPMQLLVSNDYDGTGNPNDFTWTDLTNEFDWSAGGFEWAESGVLDILSYASPTVYVAFKYTSTQLVHPPGKLTTCALPVKVQWV